MFLVFIAEVKRFRIKYVFYDDRVVREVGIFITDIRDVSYDHIDYFHTKRTLAQRILGTADLKFKTPGDPESMVLEGVGDPERWTEFIMKKANISVQ
ncbi:MAG: PH domain-containing protein [Candidatus Aenigmarchaeota archaeon]|nr:PH domain-containing protein [Candidatus Aenigmarchaeota archaeon]